IAVWLIAERQTVCRNVLAWLCLRSIPSTVSNRLRIARASHHTAPVDSVALLRIRSHFDQSRLDHNLLRWFIDCGQQLAHIVDVAASLTEKDCVCPIIDLRWIFARELRGKQRRDIFRTRIAELVAI